MATERIIFLDIDGVLNCKRTPNPRKLPYIVDPALLKRFTRVVERTGADVVLSSTWRYDPAGLFSAKHWGVPFIDVIPDMPQQPRRDEIMAWLKAHGEVSRFAVARRRGRPTRRIATVPARGGNGSEREDRGRPDLLSAR